MISGRVCQGTTRHAASDRGEQGKPSGVGRHDVHFFGERSTLERFFGRLRSRFYRCCFHRYMVVFRLRVTTGGQM